MPFLCADDTHGTPVMLKANEMGISPEELIKNVYVDHKSTYKLYDINFANFIAHIVTKIKIFRTYL